MMDIKVIVHDFKAGKKDAQAGYYDKWYRYNRSDDGEAYDRGYSEGMKITTKEQTIIEIAY